MTITTNLGITHLEPGQAQPHIVINQALDNFDKAVAGRHDFDASAGGTIALTGAQSTNHMLNPWGSPGAAFTVTVQPANRAWIFVNDASQNCTVKTPSGAGVIVQAGKHAHLYCDGVNVHYALGPQRAGAAQAAVSGTAGATYTATEQAILNAAVTLVNELRDAVVALGLIKGGA